MQKVNLLIALLLVGSMAKAQPVITAASRIKAGDWFRQQTAQVPSGSVVDTGANRLWDYSGLQSSSTTLLDSFALPSNFAVPAVFGTPQLMSYGYYTNSNGIDTNHSFFNLSADTLRYKGYLTPDNNATAHFQKPIIIFPYFPYTYGYTCADSSLSIFNSMGTSSYDTSFIVYSFKITGYGTLKLPGNRTFTNVLQVTRNQRMRRSSYTSESDYVMYMTPGNPFPLMAMSVFQGGIENIEYMTSYYSGPVGPTYTFTGNGNWSDPANWQGGLLPPNGPAPGSSIVVAGTCIINVAVTIPAGVQFTVAPGGNLLLPGNLTIL
jgi:hypothetical protein